ncbi:MAG: SPASM domain-containing protein [Treponema sp.]|nr:SPASM domain-containing protein [Treponema sp.]
MFVSKRILFFKSKSNGYMLFCGNSNSFYQIDEDNVPVIQNMIDTGDESKLPDDIREEFIKSGVLLKEDDESLFNRLKYISYLTRFDNKTLTLTIAPTMACNFSCSYCYEGERVKNLIMSDSVIDGLINFIKRGNFENLNVTWYGGEPLCAWNKIVKLNSEIKKLNLKTYIQRIVTNGSLIDVEKIKFFIENDFKMVQITLDGNEEIQNKRRPMKNGESSYKTIMANLDLAYKYCKENNKKISIIIRINIDKENIDIYPQLYQMLSERYENMFYIYPAFVQKYSETDCHAHNCLSFQSSAEFILNLSKKHGIYSYNLFPRQNIIVGCPAQRVNTFVVDTDGNLYKCWDDICMPERKLGDVINGVKDTYNLNPLFVMNGSGFEKEKCKNCLFLYSCLGGCSRSQFNNAQANYEINPTCKVIKNNPQAFLEEYYELKMRKSS